MKKVNSKNKGITLIALVITIIILLILATITIGALGGNNGLFTKAKDAEIKANKAQEQENNTLREYADVIDEYLRPSFTNIDTSETNPARALPSGNITVLESDASKGIVIKDSNDNEWTWVVVPKTTTVYTTAGLNITTFDETNLGKIETDLKAYAQPYRKGSSAQKLNCTDQWYAMDESTLITEDTVNLTDAQKALNNGCGLTYSEYKANYQKMLTSVYTNGGFWIARYEAGIAGSNASDVTTGRTRLFLGYIGQQAVSQKDMIPYNYVTCSEAQTLASSMTPDSSKISSLLFGIQWDLTCKYLEEKSTLTQADINSDSKNWGNYYNNSLTLTSGKYAIRSGGEYTPWIAYTIDTSNHVESSTTKVSEDVYLTTGASNTTSVLNISDFAGNALEWTLEYYSDSSSVPCCFRGGSCTSIVGSKSPASYRYVEDTATRGYSYAFRVVFY